MGSSVLLRQKYGTKIFLGEKDLPYANGMIDLTWAKELGFEYVHPFEPDVLLKDGDKITLGNTTIKCYHTSGHTPGTMSFVFNSTSKGKDYICSTFGGAGTNTMEAWFLEKYGLSYDCRDDFRKSLHKMADIDVDIHLGNHPFNNDTSRKVKHWMENPTAQNPFINKQDWNIFLKSCENNLNELIEKERSN